MNKKTALSLFMAMGICSLLSFAIEAKKPPVDAKKPLEDGKPMLKDITVKNVAGIKGIDVKNGRLVIDINKAPPAEIRLANGEVLDFESYLRQIEENR